MEDILATLNKAQRAAVETTEGPVLVLSGAGTGKTRVLTTRVLYILSKGMAQSWQILALTFTNKAANEMRERIADAGQNCEWCGTFHSICLKILRRHAAAAGLRQDFLIYGEDEQKAVLKSVIAALGFDAKKYVPSEWVGKISFYKDTNVRGNKKMSDDFNKIYAAYNAELERLSALDFGDIINKTIQMFESAPEILEKYRDQFKYILVDEYQDTNAMQNKLLKLLAGASESPNICCVGDDDQSIYSWRGAEIKNILHFAREYKGAKIIRLEQNYRSTGRILDAANSLIRHNEGRLGKELATNLGDGEKIGVVPCPTDLDEARFIAATISRMKPGLRFKDFAVLIRNGALSRTLEENFARAGIPYRMVGAMKFYDRQEVRDVIAYVRLMCFDFDDMSFARVISRPRRGIGDATIELLRGVAMRKKISLFAALKDFPLKPKQAFAAAEFLGAFNFDWQHIPPVDAARTLLERAGYMKMWADSNDPDKDERVKNINELIQSVVSKFDTLAEFLEHVALMTADDARDDFEDDAVSIMTVHAAKGLEFDTVFLPAWEEGIFPNELSIFENGLEEERRLAYVALTRAKRHCFISYAATRMQYGQFAHNQPSRFIAEAVPRPPVASQAAAAASPAKNMVGKTIDTEWGMGVIIEDRADHYIVAVKDGIKKVVKRDSEFGIRNS